MNLGLLLLLDLLGPMLCYSLALGQSQSDNDWTRLVARQNSEYSPCKVYCSPSTCSGSTCPVRKRDSLPEPLHNETIYSVEQDHSRLAKRKLQPLTRAEVGPYLTSQSEGIGANEQLCPAFAEGKRAPSYCIQRDFSQLPRDRQTLIGNGGILLNGCTVVTIVSTRAVYMCHIWEDAHYLGLPLGDRDSVSIENFLNVIEYGSSGSEPTLHAVGPALNRNLFSQNPTNWYISTPRARDTPLDATSMEYPWQTGILEDFLGLLLPHAVGCTRRYRPTRDRPYGFEGRALFEWDPDSDGQGTPDWRLWYEDTTTGTGRKPT